MTREYKITETTIVHPEYEAPFELVICGECGYGDLKKFAWIDPRDGSEQSQCVGCANPLPKIREWPGARRARLQTIARGGKP